MSLQLRAWETSLLSRAQEALITDVPPLQIEVEPPLLRAAYDQCDRITRDNSKTFFVASSLLPPAKRQAARALYAFCRVTDDIVDGAGDVAERQAQLEAWRQVILAPRPPANNPVALAWADARARHNIPHGFAVQLIDGVARDLSQTRYTTFADLADYAYGVASTVGLMTMYIIGFQDGEAALPYALKLGVALQLTNILRDVAQDWRAGRLYLPAEDLQQFGLGEDDVQVGVVDDRWRALMRFQIARTHQLYDESWPGVALLDADGRFAIAAAAELYRAILADIERHDGDVFSRRAHLGAWGKLSRLPGIWQRTRRLRWEPFGG